MDGVIPGFILPPSAFILHPFLVSPQKLLNVRILGTPQAFVRPAENDVSIAHHHHLAVDETKPFAFTFENNLSFVVNDRIFRTDVFKLFIS